MASFSLEDLIADMAKEAEEGIADDDGYMTVEELADALDVSKQTIRRRIKRALRSDKWVVDVKQVYRRRIDGVIGRSVGYKFIKREDSND